MKGRCCAKCKIETQFFLLFIGIQNLCQAYQVFIHIVFMISPQILLVLNVSILYRNTSSQINVALHSGRNQIISPLCCPQFWHTFLELAWLGLPKKLKMKIPCRCPTWFLDLHILGQKYESCQKQLILILEVTYGTMSIPAKFQLPKSTQFWATAKFNIAIYA